MVDSVWTKKYFKQALTDLGVDFNGSASNSALDKVLSTTLKERNPNKTAKELEATRQNLFEQTAIKLADDKGTAESSSGEVKSDCPTFGKGYKATSPECVKCAEEAKVEFDACLAKTAEAAASRASTRRA